MESEGKCTVCNSDCKAFRDAMHMGGANKYDCPQCGQFIISDMAAAELQRSTLHRGFASGSIRRMSGNPPRLSEEDIKKLAALPMPSFNERVEAYLLALADKTPALDDKVIFNEPALAATAYCRSGVELKVIVDYLEGENFLTINPLTIGAGVGQISPKGRMRAEELRSRRAASSQGFLAMWFSDEMESARREGLEVGIREAGYKPHRVDDEHHIDQIDDRIIADIRRSRFVVADLTGHRAGVYYEAGFARGLDKPVFYTCRDDQKDGIHFDIRQFNCIMWTEPAQLAKLLQDRIEAVIGLGPESVTAP